MIIITTIALDENNNPTLAEVNRAYRKAAFKNHPDKGLLLLLLLLLFILLLLFLLLLLFFLVFKKNCYCYYCYYFYCFL